MYPLIAKLYQSEILRFLFVGSLSAITNLILFYIFADMMGVDVNISSGFAFCAGVTQNYFLNGLWSFKAVKPLSFRDYMRYFCVNFGGLAVNLVALNLIIYAFNPDPKVIAQAVGIGAGAFLNYILSSKFVFKPQ